MSSKRDANALLRLIGQLGQPMVLPGPPLPNWPQKPRKSSKQGKKR